MAIYQVFISHVYCFSSCLNFPIKFIFLIFSGPLESEGKSGIIALHVGMFGPAGNTEWCRGGRQGDTSSVYNWLPYQFHQIYY
jgi:hypothetical protein